MLYTYKLRFLNLSSDSKKYLFLFYYIGFKQKNQFRILIKHTDKGILKISDGVLIWRPKETNYTFRGANPA